MKTIHDDIDHWTIIYGYGRRPNVVFVTGRGLHLLPVQKTNWADFREQWVPLGEGLVCWKANQGKFVPLSRIRRKK